MLAPNPWPCAQTSAFCAHFDSSTRSSHHTERHHPGTLKIFGWLYKRYPQMTPQDLFELNFVWLQLNESSQLSRLEQWDSQSLGSHKSTARFTKPENQASSACASSTVYNAQFYGHFIKMPSKPRKSHNSFRGERDTNECFEKSIDLTNGQRSKIFCCRSRVCHSITFIGTVHPYLTQDRARTSINMNYPQFIRVSWFHEGT